MSMTTFPSVAHPLAESHRRRVHDGLARPELRRGLAALLRRRVPRDEVADLMQTVLCDALASNAAPTDLDELSRWVSGIARHKIADYRRKSARLVVNEHAEDLASPEPPAPFEAREILGEVLTSEATLRDQKTLDWIVREHDGEALSEIASEEGLPPPAVRKRVSRLRQLLRARFAVMAFGLVLVCGALATREDTLATLDISPEPLPGEGLPATSTMTGTWRVASYDPPTGLPPATRAWLDLEAKKATVRVDGGRVVVQGLRGTLVRSIGKVETNEHGTKAVLYDSKGRTTTIFARPQSTPGGDTLVVTLSDGPIRGTVTLVR